MNNLDSEREAFKYKADNWETHLSMQICLDYIDILEKEVDLLRSQRGSIPTMRVEWDCLINENSSLKEQIVKYRETVSNDGWIKYNYAREAEDNDINRGWK